MQDVNSGYVGWSMSRRAAEAYESGEMPKSKWTKKAIIGAVRAACDELDLMYDPHIERLRKDELFGQFLYASSWHHTSKFFNATDFYAVDEDAVAEVFRPMTEAELSDRQTEREAAAAEAKAARDAMERERDERLSRWRAYRAEHGFGPDTVAAFAREHPECCHERVSRKGNRVVSYIDQLGQEQSCLSERAKSLALYGFDATEPGSFEQAIEYHQLHEAMKMLDADVISVKGEAQAMRAASAEMADCAELGKSGHDAR